MNFSILMSLYAKEQAEHLHQSLDSVFNQTLPPDEVVLVLDGCITDNLQSEVNEFSSKHSNLKIISLPQNVGLGKALNEGLKHCSYDIVARMDTDDIAKPDRFEKQIAVLENNPEIKVVSCWIEEFIDTTDNVVSTRKLPEFPFEIFEYGKKRCPVNHPSVMFKKKAVELAGGYRHFPLMEDYYLWVRLLLNGDKFYNIQESLLYFRTSEDTYRRRGGFKHAIDEVKFQYHIHRLGYTSFGRFLKNFAIRFSTRIVPNSIRVFIYKKLLR